MPSGRSFRLRPRTEVEEEEARPEKTRRIDDDEVLGVELMEALEEAESDTIHLVSLDCSMPLLTCEEPLNISLQITLATSPKLSPVLGMGRFAKRWKTGPSRT